MITSRADIGGGSKHLLDLLSSLKNNPSYDLFVASPREGEFAVSYLDICGEESFCPIPFRSFSLKSLFRLILFIKKNEIDIIHSHGHGAGSFSRLAKIFIPRVKVVHSFHGVHKRKGVVSMFYDLFEKLMKSTVSRFVCVSNDEFERAKKFGFVTKKAVVVNNGVAIPQKIENLNSKRIVSVTRFDPIKGIDLLAQTFNHCELPDEWSIEVAGDGELFDQITTENKDSKIDFKGAIYPIDSFYDEASIYISFSRGEGLPISVIEAMSRGIPCLISNVSGHYTFTIAPDKTGVIGFDLDDNEDFCKKLRSLMDNPEFRRTKGQNARKFAEENFSLSGMVSEMEKVYNSI